jgi:hypothetical protein
MHCSMRYSTATADIILVGQNPSLRSGDRSNDTYAVENSLLYKLEQRLSKAPSHEIRSATLETYSEIWAVCSVIGRLGVTPLLEDDGEDVEPHFVCFTGLRGNLGLFDGDRAPGP